MDELLIEKLLNEYDKCIISRIIQKEYNFEKLRKFVKKISEETEFIKYSDEMNDDEVLKNIQDFINQSLYGKKIGEI